MFTLFARLTVLICSAIVLTLVLSRLILSDSPQESTLRLLRGHAESFAQDLASTPPVERQAKATKQSEAIGYGLGLEEARGKAATRMENRGGDMFLVTRVPNNPGQVVLGPLPYTQRAKLSSVFVVALLVASLLSIIVSVVVHGRIRRLERVAARMQRGDFSARTVNNASDPLNGIGGALNKLADRVGELLHDERDLLRTVAHEVRTPISRMHFRVASIERKCQENLPKESAGLVKDLDQVDKLFEELLTYVGFDEFHQDRPELRQEDVNAREAVERLIEEVTGLRDDIVVTLHSDASPLISANQKLFDRAVSNLLVNAMAYGAPAIRIEIRVFEGDVTIDVQDSGPGIPEEDRAKVVKPFVRLAKKKTKGTGLGLAIVSRIMRLHGGRLHLVNAPKGGASVQLVWKSVKSTEASRRGLGRFFG